MIVVKQAPAGRKRTSSNQEARIDLLLQIANHIEAQINLGETRANLLLAAGGALVAVYITAVQASGSLWSQFETIGKWLFSLAALALMVAIVLGLRAVLPAWKVTRFGINQLKRELKPKSLVHFGIIASQSKEEFIASYHKMRESDIIDDLLDSLHGKSIKAREKFTQLTYVVLWLTISVLLFFLSASTIFLFNEVPRDFV